LKGGAVKGLGAMVKARWNDWRKRKAEQRALPDRYWKVQKECLFCSRSRFASKSG